VLQPRADRPLTLGFYEPLQDTSFPDLKRQLPHLDALLPAWMALQGPNLDFKSFLDKRALSYVRLNRPTLPILPVIQNATLGVWDGKGMAAVFADPERRTNLIETIVGFVSANGLQGVTIDFEDLPTSAYEDQRLFLSELSAAFQPHNWLIAQAAPFDDDKWPYASYAKIIDYTILMAYDQHDNTDEAGPIAGQDWYEKTLDKRMKELSPRQTVVAIGNYGYDWNGGQYADSMTFDDAAIAAKESDAQIAFDDATNNPHFSYIEDDNTKHDVWFLDGVTAYNEIHASDIYQPSGYALWRLGSEDPSIWSVLGRPYGSGAPAELANIATSQDVDFEGSGELLHIDAEPTAGSRSFEIDRATGDVDYETYTKIPTNYVIRQFGIAPHKVALSFDDGPDPVWTPKILDILKQKHAPATFFIIGANAEAYPGIVQRMIAEGHEVGNHTFTHPNLEVTPGEAVKLELNATQRLFQALTGRTMRMFRPPYIGDAEPDTHDKILPVEVAQRLGYLTVGVHVDAQDWELPGVQQIVSRSIAAVENPNPDQQGDIVLLHDAGGDRAETVAALPQIIDGLRAKGYEIVQLSDLAGLSRDQVMPKLSPTMAFMTDRVVFLTFSVLEHVLYFAFLGAIWLGITRLFFLAALSFWNRRRDAALGPALVSQPKVSVIIPAYNEAKVIATTIGYILRSDYANLDIIVVDDGSMDETSEAVRVSFGDSPKVRLIRTPNGGKANALNVGMLHAEGEIIVALDADTQFDRDTISRLVRWFDDPKVGAVAGNAKVGNRINMITRWQALEYIVAQNLERRALAALQTLTVVPGAVGAWRKSAVQAVGGYQTDTLAEDQDLTIALQRASYKVKFDASALAWTEAPTSFKGLAKQRFRWAYGTLQCLWKYRAMMFNPRYGVLGMVALPQVALFQIILTALAPLADLLLIWQLVSQWIIYQQHGAEFSNNDLATVGVYYCIFILVDLLAAVVGFIQEKREDWSLLWWLMLQRFGYRQLMYYVVVRSIATAISGPSVGWGKLERTGTVTVKRASV
ncbi:MAG: polysaccharide deacetylase family protein, partial [Alphaproteobacteria bacterium]